jgi:hypothetical protein
MRNYLQVILSTLLLFGINSYKIVPDNESQSLKSPVVIIDKDRAERSNLAVSRVEKAPDDIYKTKYILY